jgi:hypothetical protein
MNWENGSEAFVAYFNVLTENSTVGTEESHENFTQKSRTLGYVCTATLGLTLREEYTGRVQNKAISPTAL